MSTSTPTCASTKGKVSKTPKTVDKGEVKKELPPLTQAQIDEYEFIIDKAKVQLLLNQPFYANILLRLPWEYTDAIPIAAATEDTILINLRGIMDMTNKDVSQLQFILAHEVMHVAFMHVILSKQQACDPELSNIAMDFVINQLLVDGNVGKSPSQVLLDEDLVKKFDYDWYAIYNHLKKNLTGKDGNYSGGLIGKGGKCYPFDSLVQTDKSATKDSCSSTESSIKDIVASAACAARMAGKMPANMEKFVEKFLDAKIPWQDTLVNYLTQWIESYDRGYERLNRKTQHMGLILPTNIQEPGMKEIVIAVDTSGSCCGDLEQFAAEINGIKQTYGLKIRVLYGDCALANEEVFEAEDDLKLGMKGGGGTDLSPVIERVNELYDNNEISNDSILVFFTDFECPKPVPCNIPVVWALVGGVPDSVVPYGEVIRIK